MTEYVFTKVEENPIILKEILIEMKELKEMMTTLRDVVNLQNDTIDNIENKVDEVCGMTIITQKEIAEIKNDLAPSNWDYLSMTLKTVGLLGLNVPIALLSVKTSIVTVPLSLTYMLWRKYV